MEAGECSLCITRLTPPLNKPTRLTHIIPYYICTHSLFGLNVTQEDVL